MTQINYEWRDHNGYMHAVDSNLNDQWVEVQTFGGFTVRGPARNIRFGWTEKVEGTWSMKTVGEYVDERSEGDVKQWRFMKPEEVKTILTPEAA